MPESYTRPETIDFYGCAITTSDATIVPRVETEFLPDFAAPHIRAGMHIWDICCGTGCIGLAIKKNFPNTQVTLSDISPDCAALTRHNALQNNLDVEVLCGDLFEPFAHLPPPDILFCNPPYVTEAEYPTLAPSVRDHEPKRALVSGPTGLEFYYALKDAAHPTTKIFLELGTGQGPAVRAIFGAGEVKKDLAGHDRYFILIPNMLE